MEDHYDPHYELMLNYEECPNWWFGAALLFSTVVALICMYLGASSFPWWGLLVAMLVAYVFLLFWASMQAITGIGFVSPEPKTRETLLILLQDHSTDVPIAWRICPAWQSCVEHVVLPLRKTSCTHGSPAKLTFLVVQFCGSRSVARFRHEARSVRPLGT